jgi:predicted dehydrogenase
MSYSLNLGKGDNSVQLFGTQGGVHMSMGEGVKLFAETDGYLSNTTFDGKTTFDNDAYDREMNNFVDAILGRAECRNPAEDGVEIMRILDAIYRSAESGHEEVIVR